MSRIHLTIDRLVLSGLDATQRNAFVASFKAELSRQFANPVTRSEWAHSHRTPVLRLNQVAMTPGSAGARKLGTQVAKGIGKGLKP